MDCCDPAAVAAAHLHQMWPLGFPSVHKAIDRESGGGGGCNLQISNLLIFRSIDIPAFLRLTHHVQTNREIFQFRKMHVTRCERAGVKLP